MILKNLKPLQLLCTIFLIVISTAQSNAQNTDSLKVYFASGKHFLDSKEQSKLDSKFKEFIEKKILEIQILGYCDDIGSESSNWTLSGKRADYIKSKIPKDIVNSEIKINALAMGEIPITSSAQNTNDIRRNNRRALIRIIFATEPNIEVEQEEVSDPALKSVTLSNELQIGDYVVLEGILFEGGRHQPLPESYIHLENLVKALEKYAAYDFMIQGHICCQDDGFDGLDKDTGLFNLSFARAEAVYNYLVREGISPERLQYEGLKHDYPTGKGSKFDRRVELMVTGKR